VAEALSERFPEDFMLQRTTEERDARVAACIGSTCARRSGSIATRVQQGSIAAALATSCPATTPAPTYPWRDGHRRHALSRAP
jgi:hypothetical protein